MRSSWRRASSRIASPPEATIRPILVAIASLSATISEDEADLKAATAIREKEKKDSVGSENIAIRNSFVKVITGKNLSKN